MAHIRLYGFAVLGFCTVVLWIAMGAAQEALPFYTAKLVDLATGEVFAPPPESDTDRDGFPDNPFITLSVIKCCGSLKLGI